MKSNHTAAVPLFITLRERLLNVRLRIYPAFEFVAWWWRRIRRRSDWFHNQVNLR
jgi:hypothetical protein